MGYSIEGAEKLLDLIYDAATEHALWAEVLARVAELTGSNCGVMFGQSIGAEQVYFSYNGRCDPAFNAIYAERHMRNPWSLAMEDQPVGRVVFSDEIYDLSTLRPTQFFDEILAPQDAPHNAMIPLAAKDDFRAAFNICRSASQGPFGEQERKILAWLVPHLCRSIRLAFRVEGYSALQSAEFHVLERLSDGILLLDRSEKIVYANAVARRHDGGALRLRNGTVSTWSTPHSQELTALIGAVIAGSAGGAVSIPCPQHANPLTILVLALRGRDIGRFADLDMPDSAVLIFVVDPGNRAGIPIAWIMDAYGLTNAEARIALAASSGATVPETALQLGLSPNTVKTHLRHVFAKTGTNRQTELVRLMTLIGSVGVDGKTRKGI
jgi:DNA-binding CsgD family transcriptional regulator